MVNDQTGCQTYYMWANGPTTGDPDGPSCAVEHWPAEVQCINTDTYESVSLDHCEDGQDHGVKPYPYIIQEDTATCTPGQMAPQPLTYSTICNSNTSIDLATDSGVPFSDPDEAIQACRTKGGACAVVTRNTYSTGETNLRVSCYAQDGNAYVMRYAPMVYDDFYQDGSGVRLTIDFGTVVF